MGLEAARRDLGIAAGSFHSARQGLFEVQPQLFPPRGCYITVILSNGSAVAVLEIKAERDVKGGLRPSDSIYGGYANGRGEIVLFGKDLAYRVDLKKQTLADSTRLNFGAQARYDATDAGETFSFGNKTFQRLSEQQITEVCGFGCFRVTVRQLPF